MTGLLAAAAISVSVPAQPPIDYGALLYAIGCVESGNKDDAIGKDGERGRFQFTEATWTSLTPLPFSEAHNLPAARVVALKHLTDMERRIRRAGLTRGALIFELAVAWNAGEHNRAAVHNPKVAGYANRVVLLYNTVLLRRLGTWSSFPMTPECQEQLRSLDPAS